MIKIDFTIKPRVILLKMTLPNTNRYYLRKAGQQCQVYGPHASAIESIICDQLYYKYNDGITLPDHVDMEIVDEKLTVFEKDVPNFSILGGHS